MRQRRQRTAISRAYYAVYHSEDLDHRDTGFRGKDLKRLRQNADSTSSYPGDLATDIREAVAEARALIDAISRLP